MMDRLGFHMDWIVLIMRCVRSISYTVGLNNEVDDSFFAIERAKAGRPLSPYLFLIFAKGFLTLLNQAKRIGLMREFKLENLLLIICSLQMTTFFLEIL